MSRAESAGGTPEPPPLLRVVAGGEPSPEELAAVVAVLSAAPAAGLPTPSAEPTSSWTDRRAQLRTPLHPGPGAWRASARR